MVLNYAECFNVYYCTDGYKLIDVKDGAQYLLVPDGKEAPDDLDSDVIVIHQPLERIYMAATSPMALFDAIDSLDTIRLSGETADNWYVQDAVDAMNAGTMIFAGKYSEPDYELLVSENCDLAIESTMILHSPKVQEMIEMLDIPVFIDYTRDQGLGTPLQNRRSRIDQSGLARDLRARSAKRRRYARCRSR